MFAFLKDWFVKHSTSPSYLRIHERLQPLRFSYCPEERHAECVSLLERNVPHGVPEGEADAYLSSLRAAGIRTIIAEDADGQLVGTFGLGRVHGINDFWLSYVLVAPERHRRGIGTTLVIAAMAMLPENEGDLRLFMAALPAAVEFHAPFGFSFFKDRPHREGVVLKVGGVGL